VEGERQPGRIIGRYAVYDPIASGGMATVHYGRLLGPVGFSRTVAIKRLHPQYAGDPEFVSMFLDEARLAARIRHPHVVPTLDVVATEGELFLVMDYVPGESLSRLVRAAKARGERVPPRIAVAILSGVLQGLHAAHEAKNEQGEPLGIVHRDVSPQNILVGSDGQARVLDFGVAKASGRVQTTREGQLKGKISYMAPEQLAGQTLDRRSDIYSAAVVLWEALTGERLFAADNEGAVVARVLEGAAEAPSAGMRRAGPLPADLDPKALEALDRITLKALSIDPDRRFATAREMALALEECMAPATAAQVSSWVEASAKAVLAERAGHVAEIESSSAIDFVVDPSALVASSPSASSGPINEMPTVSMQSNPSNPIPEPSSQLSSVSVVAMGHPTQKGRSRRGLLLGVAAALILALVAFVVARSTRPGPAGVAASAAPVGRAVGGDVSARQVEASAAPSAPRAPESAAASASVEPAPSASTAPKAVTHRPVFHPAAPRPQCNPPYAWDAEGRKHYKPECL
jgi:eukaryotic-like serine/threonine-protein kinase